MEAKFEEAIKQIRVLENKVEIIADGKHGENCKLKGNQKSPFLTAWYGEVVFCRICHHLVE